MAPPRRLQSDPIPTKEWVESAGFQKNLDEVSRSPPRQVFSDLQAERSEDMTPAKYQESVTLLVDEVFRILNIDAAKCPQAKADCIAKCISCQILACRKWRDLRLVRTPARVRLLEQQVLATKAQHVLPFPEVGMLMAVKLLLKPQGGNKDIVSRVIKEHFLFERAAMAALVYDRDTCKGVFAIRNCPGRYCFPIPDDDHEQATHTGVVEESASNWSGSERSQEDISHNGSGVPSALDEEEHLVPDSHSQEATIEQTSEVHDNTSRSGRPAGYRDVKRRRVNDGSGPVVLPQHTCLVDDGSLTMSPEAVQNMFNAFRSMQASLSNPHQGSVAEAYSQIVMAFPEDLQRAENLTPIRGDALLQLIAREKRSQGFNNNFAPIGKVLDGLHDAAIERCALGANELRVIGKLKQLLFPREG